jgi:hypothetical protein
MNRPSTSISGNLDLQGIGLALADSRQAIDYAMEQGLPPTADIRTSSPNLILNGHRDAAVRPEPATAEDISRLDASTLPFSLALYRAMAGSGESEDHGLIAARLAIGFQTLVLKSSALKEKDFRQPIAVLQAATGNDEIDQIYNPPWGDILAGNPNLKIVRFPAGEAMSFKESDENASLVTRLWYEHHSGILYRVMRILFDRVRLVPKKGSVLIQSDNGLLKEAAYHLALRGYGLIGIRPNSLDKPSDAAENNDEILRRLAPIVTRHLQDWVTESAVEPLTKIFLARMNEASNVYRRYLTAWRQTLERSAKSRPKAILAHYPYLPPQVALYRAAKERGLPLITAQHGVSRELNSCLPNARAYYENNAADLFLTFNEKAAEFSDHENEFARGRSVPVGMPMPYWHCGDYRKPRPGSAPIIYVSTTHYMGNKQMVQVGGPDHLKASFEISLIDEVLNHLPHRVLYKLYPAHHRRYLDGDPVTPVLRKAENIEAFEGNRDLRYIFPDHRVIVTSRGMSTVGFCLMSGIPLVYIVVPHQVTLRDEVRKLFEKSVFLFDGASPTLHQDLRDFLSKPIEEIDRLWATRAEARAELIKKYIAFGGPGAGRRAADEIEQFLQASG